MDEFVVIHSTEIAPEFKGWLEEMLLSERPSYVSAESCELDGLAGKKILIAIQLNEAGYCDSINRMLLKWIHSKVQLNDPADVVFIVKSPSQFYTKSYARSLAFQLSSLGFRIVGKPLLEILPNYENFMTWKKVYSEPVEVLTKRLGKQLVERLFHIETQSVLGKRKILAIHASSAETSNTLALWHEAAKVLEKHERVELVEIGIARGSVTDCIGCDFAVCMKHAAMHDCVVGGIFVKQLMPAIESADVIVWLCPNYNDAISADLMAVINRMSGIYRYYRLDQKRFYAVVVSGNSGGDSVAMQLLDGLNLNKGFILPPHFLISEIANEPLSILKKTGIYERSRAFAESILKESFNNKQKG